MIQERLQQVRDDADSSRSGKDGVEVSSGGWVMFL